MNKTPNPNYRYIISLSKYTREVMFRITIYNIDKKLQESEETITCLYNQFTLLLCDYDALSIITNDFRFQESVVLSRHLKFHKNDYNIFKQDLNKTHECFAYLDNPYAVERIIRCSLLFLMHKYYMSWLMSTRNRRLTALFINSISHAIKHPQ